MVVTIGSAEHGSWTILMTSADVSTHIHQRLILQDGTSDAQEPNRHERVRGVILLPQMLQHPAHVLVTEHGVLVDVRGRNTSCTRAHDGMHNARPHHDNVL